MKYHWAILPIGFLAVLMVQCSEVDTGDDLVSGSNETPVLESKSEPALPGEANTMDESNLSPAISPTPFSGMDALVAAARADLAQRLSIPDAEIELVEARLVVWPDASLGCPQPGMKYKQVPEDGALILLRAQGMAYEYHSGGGRGLFLCDKVSKSPEKPPPIDLTNLTPSAPDNAIPPGEDQ